MRMEMRSMANEANLIESSRHDNDSAWGGIW